MPFGDELHDPHTIVINREGRQRTEPVLDAPFLASLRRRGVIEPIVVERETMLLIAGERRTLGAREIGIRVPIRFFDTLSPSEREAIELEENVKRADLPWRDNVSAYAKLHQLYTQEHAANGEGWSVERSAEELGISREYLYDVLKVFANLTSPRLADATSYKHAIGILERFSERKAAAIVAEISAAGSRIFALNPPQVENHHVEGSNGLGQQPTPLSPLLTGTLAPGGADSTSLPGEGSGHESNDSLRELHPGGAVAVPSTLPSAPAFPPLSPAAPILQADFLQWAPTYTGEPFTFIHCDFPYGVNTADALIESYDNDGKIYWALLDCLCANAQRLFSYSSHLMFWLSLRDDYFQPTKQRLRACGFHVIDRPLIWFKSDGRGAAPGVRGTQPRHIYEACLLASRGQRPLVKQQGDAYAAPSVSKPIHPTQKPEPMLEYFFTMLVDETTTFFDPTAGSGASIRVAEKLNARSANGLELDADYANAANASTLRARAMRSIGKAQ